MYYHLIHFCLCSQSCLHLHKKTETKFRLVFLLIDLNEHLRWIFVEKWITNRHPKCFIHRGHLPARHLISFTERNFTFHVELGWCAKMEWKMHFIKCTEETKIPMTNPNKREWKNIWFRMFARDGQWKMHGGMCSAHRIRLCLHSLIAEIRFLCYSFTPAYA